MASSIAAIFSSSCSILIHCTFIGTHVAVAAGVAFHPSLAVVVNNMDMGTWKMTEGKSLHFSAIHIVLGFEIALGTLATNADTMKVDGRHLERNHCWETMAHIWARL